MKGLGNQQQYLGFKKTKPNLGYIAEGYDGFTFYTEVLRNESESTRLHQTYFSEPLENDLLLS